MLTAHDPLYRRHRFPPQVISYAVWLYFRFPLSLRLVEEMLAERGICVTYETVRRWGKNFGKAFSDRIRKRVPARGDKWHMDEVGVSIAGEHHWLWRAVDQNGFVLDVLVQRRRDSRAAQRLRGSSSNFDLEILALSAIAFGLVGGGGFLKALSAATAPVLAPTAARFERSAQKRRRCNATTVALKAVRRLRTGCDRRLWRRKAPDRP